MHSLATFPCLAKLSWLNSLANNSVWCICMCERPLLLLLIFSAIFLHHFILLFILFARFVCPICFPYLNNTVAHNACMWNKAHSSAFKNSDIRIRKLPGAIMLLVLCCSKSTLVHGKFRPYVKPYLKMMSTLTSCWYVCICGDVPAAEFSRATVLNKGEFAFV